MSTLRPATDAYGALDAVTTWFVPDVEAVELRTAAGRRISFADAAGGDPVTGRLVRRSPVWPARRYLRYAPVTNDPGMAAASMGATWPAQRVWRVSGQADDARGFADGAWAAAHLVIFSVVGEADPAALFGPCTTDVSALLYAIGNAAPEDLYDPVRWAEASNDAETDVWRAACEKVAELADGNGRAANQLAASLHAEAASRRARSSPLWGTPAYIRGRAVDNFVSVLGSAATVVDLLEPGMLRTVCAPARSLARRAGLTEDPQ